MLGVNVVSGRIRDTPEVRLKTCLRMLVGRFDRTLNLTLTLTLTLTPSLAPT